MQTIYTDKNQAPLEAAKSQSTGGQLYGDFKKVLRGSYGGQNGFRHAIAGLEAGERVIQLHADTKHLDTQVIPILMQAPKGFESFVDGEDWVAALKHIVEVSAESITGLNKTLTVNFVENAVSGAGEIYEQATNVLRERTSVEFLWKDRSGRPIQQLLETWIMYFIMDPDTKVPKITMLDSYKTDTWTTDYQTMTVLFIAPDITHRFVDKAWLVTSMMPRTAGPSVGRRNLLEDAPIVELQIGFTGVAESTVIVEHLAEKILAKLSYISSDTDFKYLAFTDTYVAQDVTTQTGTGYNNQSVNAAAAGADDGATVYHTQI